MIDYDPDPPSYECRHCGHLGPEYAEPELKLCEDCAPQFVRCSHCGEAHHQSLHCQCELTCSECATTVDSIELIHDDPDPERAEAGWHYCEHCLAQASSSVRPPVVVRAPREAPRPLLPLTGTEGPCRA